MSRNRLGKFAGANFGPRCCASDPGMGYTPYARVHDGFPPRLESAISTLLLTLRLELADFCQFQSVPTALSHAELALQGALSGNRPQSAYWGTIGEIRTSRRKNGSKVGDPYGNRTRASAVKGLRCPSPSRYELFLLTISGIYPMLRSWPFYRVRPPPMRT